MYHCFQIWDLHFFDEFLLESNEENFKRVLKTSLDRTDERKLQNTMFVHF